ncbi:MAG TPA: hypothetical protein P5099_03925 [Candidatus Moranbacteria bacterium]|nr:hypothetical protein [Candidatus Moranbacteria bacterium]HSA08491.1 hypothetical protein [Candidatus Moranbacteria bacterium]
MKKTYYWRIVVSLISLFGIVVGYLIFSPYNYGLCNLSGEYCMFSSLKKTLAEPLFMVSMFFLSASFFLFFVNDSIFKKWLCFALGWFLLTTILIILAPVSTGGWMNFGPTKELVSIWMGSLFVILSLIQIIWQSIKARKK